MRTHTQYRIGIIIKTDFLFFKRYTYTFYIFYRERGRNNSTSITKFYVVVNNVIVVKVTIVLWSGYMFRSHDRDRGINVNFRERKREMPIFSRKPPLPRIPGLQNTRCNNCNDMKFRTKHSYQLPTVPNLGRGENLPRHFRLLFNPYSNN